MLPPPPPSSSTRKTCFTCYLCGRNDPTRTLHLFLSLLEFAWETRFRSVSPDWHALRSGNARGLINSRRHVQRWDVLISVKWAARPDLQFYRCLVRHKTQTIVNFAGGQFIITIILLSERNTCRGYTRIYESLNAANRSWSKTISEPRVVNYPSTLIHTRESFRQSDTYLWNKRKNFHSCLGRFQSIIKSTYILRDISSSQDIKIRGTLGWNLDVNPYHEVHDVLIHRHNAAIRLPRRIHATLSFPTPGYDNADPKKNFLYLQQLLNPD